jgi:large subunit ribosomal protein L24
MKKYHVKKDDKVVVNSGNFRGEKATVVAVLSKNDRVVLKLDKGDANLGKRTVKKSKANPNGGLIERAVSVHVSNVNKVAAEAKSE